MGAGGRLLVDQIHRTQAAVIARLPWFDEPHPLRVDWQWGLDHFWNHFVDVNQHWIGSVGKYAHEVCIIWIEWGRIKLEPKTASTLVGRRVVIGRRVWGEGYTGGNQFRNLHRWCDNRQQDFFRSSCGWWYLVLKEGR